MVPAVAGLNQARRGVVVLDIQHSGNPQSPNDRGAGADLNGDGIISIWEKEAELTPFYVASASRHLAQSKVTKRGWHPGHFVCIEAYGPYSDRWARAIGLAKRYPRVRVAYVACHINAGQGNNGVAFYDGRSLPSKLLAGFVADSVSSRIGEVDRCNKLPCWESPRPSENGGNVGWRGDMSKHWTWGAWSTIQGIYQGPKNISAICFEPFYIDNPSHAPLATHGGLERVGEALAIGVANWIREVRE